MKSIDLSVILPAHREGRNLAVLLPQLWHVLGDIGVKAEVLLVVPEEDPLTRSIAEDNSASVIVQDGPGYGGALRSGFAKLSGRFVLTLDADLSHRPEFITSLWEARHTAEVLIASRYVRGGTARMPAARRVLSEVLNRMFARGLGFPLRDMSSGFRLYHVGVLRQLQLSARDFDVLQEILVKAYAEGWRVREVPFRYEPRASGSSHARVIPFGRAYLRTFFRLWLFRNSILSADYDDRAFDSSIPLQRYWQRARVSILSAYLSSERPTLDVGCGSSRLIGFLPAGSVAVDILHRKLRYARRFEARLVRASGFQLPFMDGAFPCVLCSQVIEHVPKVPSMIDELCRVLAPGGRLILGTPDYGSWQWPLIEAFYARLAPGAYADEHIAHYTRGELAALFQARGYAIEAERYIMKAELIMVLRKTQGLGAA
jgi:dolichol-phosphate mannosyltransferase